MKWIRALWLKTRKWGALLAAVLMITGCGVKSQPTISAIPLSVTPTSATGGAYLATSTSAPTVTAALEITRAATELAPKPSPTIECENGLTFVSDLTVPDGTRIARGVEIDKRWQVKNSGSCNWGENYSLLLIAGPDLGGAVKQALIPARAGAEVMIRLLLTAPVIPGSYTSAWQAHDPAGEPFGDVIYLQIQVN